MSGDDERVGAAPQAAGPRPAERSDAEPEPAKGRAADEAPGAGPDATGYRDAGDDAGGGADAGARTEPPTAAVAEPLTERVGEPAADRAPAAAHDDAEPDGAEPDGAEPDRAEPDRAEPDDAERRDGGTDSGEPDSGEPDDGWRAPQPAARRLSAAGAVIGLLVGLLGFALVVQLRSTRSDSQLASARPDDLVRILSDLDSRQDRLRSEIASLEDTRRTLESGAQGREAVLAQARKRADELGILAGTLPAEGPGLQIRFEGGSDAVPASTVLDAVEELRGAGAEAMQIAGSGSPPVRIVASTYFIDAADGLVVDGQHLSAPYTLTVIGDPATMQTALNIPGGVVDTARQHGGNVIPQEVSLVHVTAVRQPAQLKYAHPVS